MVDEKDNRIIGVLGIDINLSYLSDFLNETSDNPDWKSWVFESSAELGYAMVASSDKIVSQSGSDLETSNLAVSISATEHENRYIQLFSLTIAEIDGVMQSLPINDQSVELRWVGFFFFFFFSVSAVLL